MNLEIRMLVRLLIVTLVLTVAAGAAASDLQALYDQRCASCHNGSTPKAPHQVKFQMMGGDTIYQALTEGLMKPNAAGIDAATLRALADFLGGEVTSSASPVKRCANTTIPAATPALAGWGFTPENTRFIDAAAAQLAAADALRLAL
ncbi:MAG: c-type cytochrome [Pseudomonadales bacterium]